MIGAGVVAAAAALVIGTGGASAAVPVAGLLGPTATVVTEAHPQGFAPTDDRPVSSRTFTEEFGGAAGSAGALKLVTEDDAGKADFFHSGDGASLTSFATPGVLGYNAYRDPASTANANLFPSLQLQIDKNGGTLETGDFSTLTFEPVYQVGPNANQTAGTWNRYDGSTGLFCSTRQIGGFEANQTRCDNGGTLTLAAIAAANPGATILAFGFNQGSGNPGLTSAVDNLTVPGATYDFELKEPTEPTTPGGGGNNGGNNERRQQRRRPQRRRQREPGRRLGPRERRRVAARRVRLPALIQGPRVRW